MRFNIISNLMNGAGLQQDCEILRSELQARGHTVHGVQFNRQVGVPYADVNLFVETVVPTVFRAAPRQWVIPNPEWWLESYQASLPRITKFLCKTRDSLRVFTDLAGDRAEYLGFVSRDLYHPGIERQCAWLHIAGKSNVKNTDAILAAWKELPYELTLVTSLPRLVALASKMRHVTVHQRVTDAELRRLLNQHAFYLCPSKYEGFGHTLHEAMSVGALVVTRDGPPMDEFGIPPELLVSSQVESQLRLAQMRRVEPEEIVGKVHYVTALPYPTIQSLSRTLRMAFEARQTAFRQRLTEVLKLPC